MTANKLTKKQEKFCANLVQGMSHVEAYRLAYGFVDYPESYNELVWIKAADLVKAAKIRKRLEIISKGSVVLYIGKDADKKTLRAGVRTREETK